tara:strand:- start:412 stop:597 length:186 start_codon:yes stop_codon:yes gene_type:complete
MKHIEYWFDEEREMIYFSNGHQSLVSSCGKFFWKIEGKSVFFEEDMVELQQKTGYIFKQRK